MCQIQKTKAIEVDVPHKSFTTRQRNVYKSVKENIYQKMRFILKCIFLLRCELKIMESEWLIQAKMKAPTCLPTPVS